MARNDVSLSRPHQEQVNYAYLFRPEQDRGVPLENLLREPFPAAAAQATGFVLNQQGLVDHGAGKSLSVKLTRPRVTLHEPTGTTGIVSGNISVNLDGRHVSSSTLWNVEVIGPQQTETRYAALVQDACPITGYSAGNFAMSFSEEFKPGRSGKNPFVNPVDMLNRAMVPLNTLMRWLGLVAGGSESYLGQLEREVAARFDNAGLGELKPVWDYHTLGIRESTPTHTAFRLAGALPFTLEFEPDGPLSFMIDNTLYEVGIKVPVPSATPAPFAPPVVELPTVDGYYHVKPGHYRVQGMYETVPKEILLEMRGVIGDTGTTDLLHVAPTQWANFLAASRGALQRVDDAHPKRKTLVLTTHPTNP